MQMMGTLVSSTNKTCSCTINEILLKMTQVSTCIGTEYHNVDRHVEVWYYNNIIEHLKMILRTAIQVLFLNLGIFTCVSGGFTSKCILIKLF